MILTALATILVLLSVAIVGCVLMYRRLKASILSFVSQPDEKTPSPLATFIDTCAFVFSQRLVLQLKSTVMGMNSVDSKIEQREAVATALEGNPSLAAALQFIPGARRLMKNPQLLTLLTGALAKVGKGAGGDHTNMVSPGWSVRQFPL